MPSVAIFSIGQVSQQTGLSTHTIRAWERRYGAVTPERLKSGRRVYSQGEIDRLVLLRQLAERGYRISQIAKIDQRQIKSLVDSISGMRSRPVNGDGAYTSIGPNASQSAIVRACMQAVTAFDRITLRDHLQQASLNLNHHLFLTQVIEPFMHQVGAQWSHGELRIVHGHLAANTVHAQLTRMLETRSIGKPPAPRIMIATPFGQWCHLGAMAVAIVAQDHGWEPVYVGSNLPSEEIAAAEACLKPQLIALSITCRVDDSFMHDELKRLVDLIGQPEKLVVGGKACHYYRGGIEAEGASVSPTVDSLVNLLQ